MESMWNQGIKIAPRQVNKVEATELMAEETICIIFEYSDGDDRRRSEVKMKTVIIIIITMMISHLPSIM